MKHWADDDLIIYYYGEGRHRDEIARHLAQCAACAASFRELSETLNAIGEPDVPERGDQYGLEVWQRIRHRLPEQQGLGAVGWGLGARGGGLGAWGWGLGGETLAWARGFAIAGALAVLLIAAFVTGRLWQPAPSLVHGTPVPLSRSSLDASASTVVDDGVRDRILLTAVADHLERSERVLTDLMNAPGGDISQQQQWADDLVQTGRLYRQDALDAGEQSVAMVLDALERNLLEIVHSPSQISAADLEQVRRRIDAAALLFKVRVLGDELRRRETLPANADPQFSNEKVS